MDEVLISGGTLVDGSGAAPRVADVLLRDGRVAHIGEGASAGHVIDASGLVVAPGFVDLHSHADFTLTGQPDAEACVRQGVTTLVTGNCGLSTFPAPAFGVDLGFFADSVEAARPAVNVAPLVGHGALRAAVLGQEQRQATPEELAEMRRLLAVAAGQGAFGLTTGLIYAPGSFADTAEIEALATEAASHGLLYATHMRDEGDRLIEAVGEAIGVARASGVRLQISHLKAMGPANHGKVAAALEMLESAVAGGLDVACDVYPYTASSTTLTSRLPGWALDGGTPALLERLADPEARERILEDLRPAVGRTFLPEGVIIASLGPGRFADRVGDSIASVAKDLGVEPAEAVLEVLAAHEASVSIVNHAMAEDDVDLVLRHPSSAVASDGWVLRAPGEGHPHPRSFGTFARVLGHYTRERGLLDLAESVRKMTSLPASRLAMTERGTLAPGRVADVVVFDPERVEDLATYADPWHYAAGVRDVFVAGRAVLLGGEITGARPGRVLRGRAA
ncbi:N-acyl-D-amino-acid deacylase [Nonomuraea soli]|uniref:N-acyl-D-amino-acid deacylase n=2 Tax=Nonomuraea soli TaxID=1032476 RepID=A0A7W0CPW4_9ACTN|nr:D-aminoacylase [Nonomuraea soli]MBA2895137.1 N-acyl-D-amino-acid deacylase [Nonomuraea soli]